MKKTVLIAGAAFPGAAGCAQWFRARGDAVWEIASAADEAACTAALEEIRSEGRLDLLVIQATRRSAQLQPLGQLDYPNMTGIFEESINGAYALIEAALPLLRQGGKRLGLITTATTSVREPQETDDFAFAMAQAGLHMLWKLYFNRLRPEGFTFRCFCPAPDGSGLSAGEYMNMDFCYDAREEYIHSEENRIVLRDSRMREISW